MLVDAMVRPATSTEDRADLTAERDVSAMRTHVVTAPSGKVCAERLDPIARIVNASGWVVAFVSASTSSSGTFRARTELVSEAGSRISAFSQMVDEMKFLHPDWNGYGSEPPNDFARELARQILLSATTVAVPSRVTPSVQGGVGICFNFKGKYADIECLNSGDILATTSNGKAMPEVWEVKPTNSKGALERIARFLNS